ncbi:MAG: hypothetical protein A2W31_05030 [Planctomycetes bacterium RBG_16_64_10]|nr:MAG: hypothetical protein A2W31_05030 [Planctomycetes bacterium RBG_16_64_10]
MPEGWECSDPGKRFEAEIRDIIRDEFDGHALWGFKDPRTCQLVPFWQRLLTELGRRPHYVITFRHPMDVAASLAKRDGMGLQQALDLWYQRVTQALSDTSALERVVVSYDMLLANWRGVAEGIGAKLCVKWPHAPQEIAVQAAEFIDANLHHHRDGARSQLPRHLEAVYEELKGLETWAQ